jgi:general secretion pathway protein E
VSPPDIVTVRHKLSAADFRAARARAGTTGRRPLVELEERLGATPDAFVIALAGALRYDPMPMAELNEHAPAFDLIPYADAVRRECVALRAADGAVVVAFADPFSDTVRGWLAQKAGASARTCIAHHADLAAFLSRHETSIRAMEGIVSDDAALDASGIVVEDVSLEAISDGASPVVKLVHSTLHDALKSGVSDVHLETSAEGLAIKYRIDGVLNEVARIPGIAFAEQAISRLKVMSELDIAERRVPQDGRFRVSIRAREVDFRVSIMPSVFGEDAVLRILDKQSLGDKGKGLRLDYLGFDDASLVELRRLSTEPYGMVLVTGPTGSGKTTTLYAALSEINSGRDKIITIEDPVEYQLPGILQIPVNERKGLTFARGLRSILRHDPDKIMVGEIRDPETAQIAIQSALTGHLVFTTVHANSVFDVLGRFLHMGVDAYSFVSALNGVMAQRLVRVICDHCASDYTPSAELLERSRLQAMDIEAFRFRHGSGCGICRGTGYRGRKGIAELLTLNDELRELIVERASLRTIKEAARRSGTRFLRDSALQLVASGHTTLEEINRVTLVQ